MIDRHRPSSSGQLADWWKTVWGRSVSWFLLVIEHLKRTLHISVGGRCHIPHNQLYGLNGGILCGVTWFVWQKYLDFWKEFMDMTSKSYISLLMISSLQKRVPTEDNSSIIIECVSYVQTAYRNYFAKCAVKEGEYLESTKIAEIIFFWQVTCTIGNEFLFIIKYWFFIKKESIKRKSRTTGKQASRVALERKIASSHNMNSRVE